MSDESEQVARDQAADPSHQAADQRTPLASAILSASQDRDDLLNLAHDGARVRVGFNSSEMPDETRVARYRKQLHDYLQKANCKALTFDLAGLMILPSRMLGLFISLKTDGHDVELVNMSQNVQNIFRVTKISPLFTINGAT